MLLLIHLSTQCELVASELLILSQPTQNSIATQMLVTTHKLKNSVAYRNVWFSSTIGCVKETFEVVTGVIIKAAVFWNVVMCSHIESYLVTMYQIKWYHIPDDHILDILLKALNSNKRSQTEPQTCIPFKDFMHFIALLRRLLTKDIYSLSTSNWVQKSQSLWTLTFRNLPISVAMRSQAQVCGRALAGIMGSNPTRVTDVCLVQCLSW
jgi:hypothetical protein